MGKELITKRQALYMLILFMLGSSLVMGVNGKAEQDSWLPLLLAAVTVVPFAAVYARIIRLYPGKDIFEILEILFGKIFGKILIILMSWYALHLASLVLRNFSEFIQITSMPETPQLPLMVAIMLVTAYIAKSGIEALGRWSLVAFPVVVLVVLATTLLAIPKMELTNILPIMEHDFGTIASSTFGVAAFPYAETVIFLGVASTVKTEDSPYRIFIYAILMTAVVLLIVFLRNLEVLGVPTLDSCYFPSFAASRIIEIGNFLSRIEGVVSMNFLLTGVIKISLCLIAAAKGTARLFGFKDYRVMVMPIGIMVVALCAIVYDDTMHMFNFLQVYQYYAMPFQFVIPLMVWIFAEVKKKTAKNAKSTWQRG